MEKEVIQSERERQGDVSVNKTEVPQIVVK